MIALKRNKEYSEFTKVLYLIRGVSGSGKSHLAWKITPCEVSADNYFYDGSGKYKFISEKLSEAHKFCQNETEIYMLMGAYEIAVHNTFTRRWELEPYYKLAEKYGYKVVEIIIKSNFKNIHGVPAEKVEKQQQRFEF